MQPVAMAGIGDGGRTAQLAAIGCQRSPTVATRGLSCVDRRQGLASASQVRGRSLSEWRCRRLWLSSGRGGSQSESAWLDRSRASRRLRHVPSCDPADLRRGRDRAGAVACRSSVGSRGRRSEELSARLRHPPRTDAERAKKARRADNKRRTGGPTTPPSCLHSHLSERKGDQQAIHRLPRAPEPPPAPSQRDPGRCRLHPRSTRSRGKVEPLTRAPSTRGTFPNTGAGGRSEA